MNNHQNSYASKAVQEKYFLDALPLVRRIAGYKFNPVSRDLAEEITQRVALKLWNWKQKRPDRFLSDEEWQKLANTAAHNEIKRFYLERARQRINSTESLEIAEPEAENGKWRENVLNGNSRAEVRSLVGEIWKIVRNQSLREKYALLLKRPDFIRHLLSSRCCRLQEIADELQMTSLEMTEILKTLPLSDEKIGDLLGAKINAEVAPERVKKARQRMLAKLRDGLALHEHNDDETSFRRDINPAERGKTDQRSAG